MTFELIFKSEAEFIRDDQVQPFFEYDFIVLESETDKGKQFKLGGTGIYPSGSCVIHTIGDLQDIQDHFGLPVTIDFQAKVITVEDGGQYE